MVALHAAMKSGLKGPNRGWLFSSRHVALHAAMKSGLKALAAIAALRAAARCTPCRDEKRTESSDVMIRYKILMFVALHAAMKSGLKALDRHAVRVFPGGCTPCRDEKRTESTFTGTDQCPPVSSSERCCTPCRDEKRTERRCLVLRQALK